MTTEQKERVQRLLDETAELRVALYGTIESSPEATFNLLTAAQTQFATIIDIDEMFG